jgi:hypothetical protein
MHPETQPSNATSIAALLKDLRDESSTLLRQEVALAKTELKENTTRMTNHLVHIAIGGVVAYAGGIVLLIGLGHLLGALLVRAGVDNEVATWLAPALLGLVVALIGWGMLARAKSALAHDDVLPRRTLDSLRTNKEWAQTKLQHSS